MSFGIPQEEELKVNELRDLYNGAGICLSKLMTRTGPPKIGPAAEQEIRISDLQE